MRTELFVIGYSVNTIKSPRFLPVTASFRLSASSGEMLMLTNTSAAAAAPSFTNSVSTSRDARAMSPHYSLFRVPHKPEILISTQIISTAWHVSDDGQCLRGTTFICLLFYLLRVRTRQVAVATPVAREDHRGHVL